VAVHVGDLHLVSTPHVGVDDVAIEGSITGVGSGQEAVCSKEHCENRSRGERLVSHDQILGPGESRIVETHCLLPPADCLLPTTSPPSSPSQTARRRCLRA